MRGDGISLISLYEKCIHERKEYALVSNFFSMDFDDNRKKIDYFTYTRSNTGGIWKRKVLNGKMTMLPKMQFTKQNHQPYHKPQKCLANLLLSKEIC